ncbi:transcription factor HES-4-B isoform X1 [Ciona intestinalis]
MFREKALVSGCQGPSIKVGAIMTSPTHIVYCDKTFVTIMFLSFIGGVRRRQTSLANEAATNKSFVETSTKMKRDYVDSDSDDDDAKRFDTPPQTSARKKRRGVIEKRRRDRINNSLSELRRMIPTASEKHGSSKLEKAEILQLTVEHLKTLQSAISKGYFPFMDVRTMAVDYRSFGFRECVSEVARYMISMDGIQSSVRDNLLSHLQNVMTHKPTVSPQPWPATINNVIRPHYVTSGHVMLHDAAIMFDDVKHKLTNQRLVPTFSPKPTMISNIGGSGKVGNIPREDGAPNPAGCSEDRRSVRNTYRPWVAELSLL